MVSSAPGLLSIPFSEVRHWQPDDCLHYESIGVRGALHDWTIPAHRHDSLHQFQLLEHGGAQATIDGRPQTIVAPALSMFAPGSVHGFVHTPDSTGHQITIPTATLRNSLRGAGPLEPWLGQSQVLGADVLPRDEALAFVRLFESLASEFAASHPGRVHALLAQATLIVLGFLRLCAVGRGEPTPGAVRDTLVQRLRALVEMHFREHRPLAFYADKLGVTPDHLSRSCRAVTGSGALDLLHGRLMLEARRLLAYTPMPVAEIARALGYDDAAYFSKFFARSVGESPSGYRNSVAKGVRLLDAQAP